MTLLLQSEYVRNLSVEAREWYQCKLAACELSADPYLIEDWTQSPEVVPNLQWSDVANAVHGLNS